MTILEYWKEFEELESPFDDTSVSHVMDFKRANKIYSMERKLRLVMSVESNGALDEYIESIFGDFSAYKPYHSKVADFILDRLQREVSGEFDVSRKESNLPTPFSLDWDIDVFFKTWSKSFKSVFEKINFKLYLTEWFGLKFIFDEFPFRVCYYKDSIGLVFLKLWRAIC